MINYNLLVILLLLLTACSPEHESLVSNVFKNNIPKSGITIKVSKSGELINILKLEAPLNTEQQEIFDLSMQWIATETEVPFTTLAGKSAFDIVQIANCLKSNNIDCIK